MYFYVSGAKSVITIGIAGPDIHDDIHPGDWHGSVGYKNTGQCTSSHISTANTGGQTFTTGMSTLSTPKYTIACLAYC